PCPVCDKPVAYHKKSDPIQCCSKECRIKLRKKTISSDAKVCEICGKIFYSEGNTARYCPEPHYRPCPICGKPVQFYSLSEPLRCCSTECKEKHREQTCLEKYGESVATKSDSVREKIRITCNSPESVEKRKNTSLLLYGETNPSKSPEVRRKIRRTLLSSEYRKKYRFVMQSHYGVDYPMQSDELKHKQFETCQERYDVPYACMLEQCRNKNHFIVSNRNRSVSEIFRQHNIETTLEFKIGKYAFDLFLVGFDTFIEVDPTYTHNAIGNHWNKTGIDKYYHVEKTKIAVKNGYRCIHLFDWDDIEKIAAMFHERETLYARKCSVQVIEKQAADEFIDKYHLQGECNGQLVCLGLYSNGILIQVMTFGKPRYNKKYQYELLRLCSDSEVSIVGGAEKLFKYFIRNYSPESIISYCDLAKFSGDVYERLGFTHLHNTEPNKIWSNGIRKITNNLLMQRGYDQLFNTNYGKGTNNGELMLQHGWLPVYDCGQGVYVWKSE
ncbi:MAG: hypothetical protein NC548_50125, partial [Lachnospiraceae bacterium]|nr:hypothetical protein [Lachnospiraceae bacterium]